MQCITQNTGKAPVRNLELRLIQLRALADAPAIQRWGSRQAMNFSLRLRQMFRDWLFYGLHMDNIQCQDI